MQQIDRRIILDALGHPNCPNVYPLLDPEDIPLSTGLITQAPVNTVPTGGHRPIQLTQNGLPLGVFPNVMPMAPPMPPRPYSAPPPPGMHQGKKPSKVVNQGSGPRHRKSTESLSSYYSESDGKISELRMLFVGFNVRGQNPNTCCTFLEDEDEDNHEEKVRTKLSENQLQLTSSRMLGFCLKEKKWRKSYFR